MTQPKKNGRILQCHLKCWRVFRKGTETVKEKAKNNYLDWKCPICGKVLKLKPYETKNRKTCGSQECINKSRSWEKGVKAATESIHIENVKRKEIIKKDIIEWVLNNKIIVNECPYNRITNALSGLQETVLDKYGLKDLRSIFICFNVKNKRELLDELKKISKENIC